LNNHKQFFDFLLQKLGYNKLDDFYKISVEDVRKHGGKALLERVYEGSLKSALKSIYPQHHWLLWKFEQSVPDGFWNQKENQKEFMDWLYDELEYKHPNDWYNVTRKQISEKGGVVLLAKYGNSIFKLVKSVYPEQKWKQLKFRKDVLDNIRWYNTTTTTQPFKQ
jgi:hypothetical protein